MPKYESRYRGLHGQGNGIFLARYTFEAKNDAEAKIIAKENVPEDHKLVVVYKIVMEDWSEC